MPQIRMRDSGGTLRTITQIRMRDAAGTLRTITRVRMRDESGTLRIVFTNFSVGVSSTSDYVFSSGGAPGTVTSSTINGLVAGGIAPLTYAWERLSGSASISATAPTAVNSAFSVAKVGAAGTRTSEWRLKVTDNGGNIQYSPTVSIELEWG